MTDVAEIVAGMRELDRRWKEDKDRFALGMLTVLSQMPPKANEESIFAQAAAALESLVNERDVLVQECELLEQEKNMLEDDVEPLNQEICNLKDIIDSQQKPMRLGIGKSLDSFLQELGELDEVTRLAFQRHGEQCLRDGRRQGLEEAVAICDQKSNAYGLLNSAEYDVGYSEGCEQCSIAIQDLIPDERQSDGDKV